MYLRSRTLYSFLFFLRIVFQLCNTYIQAYQCFYGIFTRPVHTTFSTQFIFFISVFLHFVMRFETIPYPDCVSWTSLKVYLCKKKKQHNLYQIKWNKYLYYYFQFISNMSKYASNVLTNESGRKPQQLLKNYYTCCQRP